MSNWLDPRELGAEITQREEEGCGVTDLKGRLEALDGQASAAQLLQLWVEVEALVPSRSFPYAEPTDLAGIRAERPSGPRQLELRLSQRELYDRVYGAWLGRAAGCLLGKPVEGWKRGRIRRLLEHVGEYPLSDYFPWMDAPPPDADYRQRPRNWFRGNIDRMVRDDDMDYPVLGLRVLESKGKGFTSADVADTWLRTLPYLCVYTAERVAYRNLVEGLVPPASASYRNPYREWIGAQIRADIWGYAAPGNPELAAEYAFRDAAVSHAKNGVYGEMFFAALIAAAFATQDLRSATEVALTEIPSNCRLAEAVRNVVAWSSVEPDWERTMDRVLAEYGHYHCVHTINNAAIVLVGLLYSGHDLEPAICRAVLGGEDTDCNGATAGSVVGAIVGADALPREWVDPLNDRLLSLVAGDTDNPISDLAKRTLAASR